MKVKISLPHGVSEIKLSYNPVIRPAQRLKISHSLDCYKLLKDHWDMDKIDLLEEFKIILLDRHKGVIGFLPISQGGMGETLADTRIIFSSGLIACASSIILAHNHPSGHLRPSRADLHLTKRLADAGKLIEIDVCDHLIIGKDGYYSFADEGELNL